MIDVQSNFALIPLRQLVVASLLSMLTVAFAGAQERVLPPPTQANVKYGSHERHVLDLWQAESDEPAPLAVFIHGGGFRRGSKEQLHADLLRDLLSAGISVAALNYRFAQDVPLPAAHHD